MSFLDDDRYNPPSEVQLDHVYDKLPQGRDFRPGDYESELMALLQPHPSSWRIVDKSHYGELANLTNHGGRVKIATHQGGKWIEARDLQQAKTGKGMAVFVRRPASENKVGGRTEQVPQQFTPQPYQNLEPTVRITTPSDGAKIDINDRSKIRNLVTRHEFAAGDTVESFTEKYAGEVTPSAVFNHNNGRYHQNNLPQGGDIVECCTGKQLRVDGTVSNSPTVALTWTGGTSDSQSIDVGKVTPNSMKSWDLPMPVKPGDYTLTARAGSASHSIKVSIVEFFNLLINFEYKHNTVIDDKLVALKMPIDAKVSGSETKEYFSKGAELNKFQIKEMPRGEYTLALSIYNLENRSMK